MERNELAARFLPSFIYPTTSNRQDRTLALDKAYKMADAFLERANQEPNTMLLTFVDIPSICSCNCQSENGGTIGEQEHSEHVYSGDVYVDALIDELRRLYVGRGPAPDADERIVNKGQVLRLVERFTVPPGAELNGKSTQDNDAGPADGGASGAADSVRSQ